MKTTLASALALNLSNGLRLTALAATLTFVTARVFAQDNSSADRAAQGLALTGSVLVKNAGPYVEVGTFRIQVAVKLGQPTAKLADGTWLYQHYQVEDSAAAGTLVVRFDQGRVCQLSLITPAVATAMTAPKRASDRILVAANK